MARIRVRKLILQLTVAATCVSCGRGDAGIAPPGSTLTLAVSAELAAGPYIAGQSYFGRSNYIEYIAGNSPVIYTAPHGGSLSPAEIPDRTAASCGESVSTAADLNTADLVRGMQQAHFIRFGTWPHIVINHLHRRKLDANRTLVAGACGDTGAAIAWEEWHDFIAAASNAVVAASGRGWYMDVHGHGHDKQRLELGYLTTGAQLRLADATLDATAAFEDSSSVGTLSRHSAPGFSALLRGGTSLGTLYAANGFPAVPSAGDPAPASGDEYFSGGYNTARHGCGIEATALGGTAGGSVCGVQVEANYTDVRDAPANRQRFADATARVMEQYLGAHWALRLGDGTSAPVQMARLAWSGSTASTVDIYRNGLRRASVPNTGVHTDAGVRGGHTFTYRVCEAGTNICSANAAMTF